MRAVALNPDKSLESASNCLFLDVALDMPSPKPTDLLVQIKAAGINPIDVKLSKGSKTPGLILGFDVCGIVHAVGSQVVKFKKGDPVYYAGAVNRPGGFAEYQLVDERIVGTRPSSLSFSQAACLPLAAITCWEALFEKLHIKPKFLNNSDLNKNSIHDVRQSEPSILIIGGAGGVGSLAIQLAKRIAGLRVIATASRQASVQQCLDMGATSVINHHESLLTQLKELDIKWVDYVLCLTDPAPLFSQISEVIAPLGRVCSLVESSTDLPMNLLRNKSVSFSWEGAFTRSLFKTPDMKHQGEILDVIAHLVDKGQIHSTLKEDLGSICAEHLQKGCQIIESAKAIGKLVMTGFDE
jgi:zinc-binding alcohol dehydrogenase family protein